MPEESVKVAVRVRPFNKRERARNAKCIVEMKGIETTLTDPDGEDEPRKFAFDYSYWSFDGSKGDANGYYGPDPGHPNGKKFCDQNTVFNDLGIGVLKNAWEGFNSTLFAYGQTGSGKSWSVVGYGINKGIVPLFCEKIFKQIEEKKAAGDTTEFQIIFSMLEIYNEEVRDLLVEENPRGGMRVRENPATGFYAQGLTMFPVSSYKAIEDKMAEGTENRTVAATQMNATSSRAHTIVSITFVQKYKNAAGAETAKKSAVNLVDLAGSERAENTGATGDRLKEGAAINQSLSSLGNCIAALADNSNGKSVRVPFRDSALTKLLKNALGGNSKTVMIAAISPADINYAESLSTLRYADRAKQIKTVAVVNEDPTEKLIRELKDENDKLKQMLESGGVELPEGNGEHGIEKQDGMSKAETDAMKKELEEEYQEALLENERKMAEMQKNYEDMLKEAQEKDAVHAEAKANAAEKVKTHDYLTNLNMDPALSGHIKHAISGNMSIGNKRGEPTDICLPGPSILEKHATLVGETGSYTIEKCAESARLLVNGEPLQESTKLNHLDRIMFGTTQLYVFVNHTQQVTELPEYSDAMEEIAKSAGFDTTDEEKTPDEMLLKEDVLEILPSIEEANSISEEMDKKLTFEAVIVSPESRGVISGRPELFVHLTNIETGLEYYWSREKFYNRKFVMQELFSKYDDDNDDFSGQIADERDPFTMNPKEDVHIGSLKVYLHSLAYNIELHEQLDIIDYQSEQIGVCNVEINPCTAKGKVFKPEDDVFVDDPQQLIGQEFHFKVKIMGARGLPKRYNEIYAEYRLAKDVDAIRTKAIAGTNNPDWRLEHQYDFPCLTEEELKYFMDGCFMVRIYGKQNASAATKHLDTKKELRKKKAARGQVACASTSVKKKIDPASTRLQQQADVVTNRNNKLNKRLEWLKDLLREANKKSKKKVPTRLVIEILEAKNQKEARRIIASLGKAKGGEHSDSDSEEEVDIEELKAQSCTCAIS